VSSVDRPSRADPLEAGREACSTLSLAIAIDLSRGGRSGFVSGFDVCAEEDGLYLVSESGGDITPNAVFPVSSGIYIHLAHRRLAFGAISPLNSASPVGQPNTAHGYTHATRSRPLAETGSRVELRNTDACPPFSRGNSPAFLPFQVSGFRSQPSIMG